MGEDSYTQDCMLEAFSKNLKKLLEESGMDQKRLAQKTGISESTLSGYMKKRQAPNLTFLAALKSQFPGILLDDILFNDLGSRKVLAEPSPDSISDAECAKYVGTYYLYYLDTSKKPNSKLASESVHETIDMKFGILYVSSISGSKDVAKLSCIAIFGIRTSEEAQQIKDEMDLQTDHAKILDRLKKTRSRGLYLGQLHMSQMHIFVTLDKAVDVKDHALIILHRTPSNKDHYFGGIGTINSVSTGRTSEPIVQLIGLSKNRAYLSDEQIKSRLRFSAPDIHVKGAPEADEILKLVRSMYRTGDATLKSETPYAGFSEQNIEMLLTSYMEYLISKNLENHQLWCGRVSADDDDDWYHLLKESENYQKDHQKGVAHGIAGYET